MERILIRTLYPTNFSISPIQSEIIKDRKIERSITTDRSMSGSKGTVCVTGANGFVASWLIKTLLESGYTVRGTVRQIGNRDLRYITDLPGAAERLQLVEADLNNPGSFDSAVEGCVGVFHTAHPMDREDEEPVDVIVKRAVHGALGILKAVLKAKTVKRVVYTSSVATVLVNDKPGELADETSWSDVDFIRDLNMPRSSYTISKTLTEKAVLEFAEKNELDVVTVIPPFVTGPFICPRIPYSTYKTMAMISGRNESYDHLLRTAMVHVDDLVRAQIFLLEKPEAKGRYICCAKNIEIDELAEFLSSRYPEYSIPSQESLKEVKGMKHRGFSSKKLLDAGFEFNYGLDHIYDDAIKTCKEKGLFGSILV